MRGGSFLELQDREGIEVKLTPEELTALYQASKHWFELEYTDKEEPFANIMRKILNHITALEFELATLTKRNHLLEAVVEALPKCVGEGSKCDRIAIRTEFGGCCDLHYYGADKPYAAAVRALEAWDKNNKDVKK